MLKEEVLKALDAIRPKLEGDGGGIEAGEVDIHPLPRPPEIDHYEAEDEGERCDGFEVEDGLEGHPPGSAHVLHPGDAVHDGAEYHRGDEHLDQLDEAVAERLHGLAGVGRDEAEGDTGERAGEDLEPELAG